MATKNPRINITFEETTVSLLSQLAQEAHKSVSGFAKELILEALERREDMALSLVAEARDIKGAEKIKHSDAWR